MKIFLVLAVLLAVQSVVSLHEGFKFLRYVRRRFASTPRAYAPDAAVIVPCKGLDPGFDANVMGFMTQDYPRYRLVFAVASAEDDAYVRLQELVESAGRGSSSSSTACDVSLVVAGYSGQRAEKVHNILRGLEVVPREVEVLVFADADMRPHRAWLRSLVAPLADSGVTVSTGYRWYLPGRTFASRLRAAWDASVATMFGEHNRNIAWGGSMALRVPEFRHLRVAEHYWASTASDDYALTQAVREARGYIHFEPRCLVASREESTVGEFLSWANRQIILTRVYAARLWLMGLASHFLYCSTFVVGLILLLATSAPWPLRTGIAAALGAILALGVAKGYIRTVIARELFLEKKANPARYGSCYWSLAPVVPWVMLLNFVTAAFTRRIDWRGVRYDLRSASEVRVLRRD